MAGVRSDVELILTVKGEDTVDVVMKMLEVRLVSLNEK